MTAPTVSDAVHAMFKYLDRSQYRNDELIMDAIDRLPPDHPAQGLARLAFMCPSCRYTNFLTHVSLNMANGEAACPSCDYDGLLDFAQAGAA